MNWSQLDTVLEVVNKLKATNSNKDKLAILKSYIGHEDEKMICKVLNYTYDTFRGDGHTFILWNSILLDHLS